MAVLNNGVTGRPGTARKTTTTSAFGRGSGPLPDARRKFAEFGFVRIRTKTHTQKHTQEHRHRHKQTQHRRDTHNNRHTNGGQWGKKTRIHDRAEGHWAATQVRFLGRRSGGCVVGAMLAPTHTAALPQCRLIGGAKSVKRSQKRTQVCGEKIQSGGQTKPNFDRPPHLNSAFRCGFSPRRVAQCQQRDGSHVHLDGRRQLPLFCLGGAAAQGAHHSGRYVPPKTAATEAGQRTRARRRGSDGHRFVAVCGWVGCRYMSCGDSSEAMGGGTAHHNAKQRAEGGVERLRRRLSPSCLFCMCEGVVRAPARVATVKQTHSWMK